MTATIKTSQIAALGATLEQFETAVIAHSQEMRWHRDHHADASRDPYPAPAANPLVDFCVGKPALVPDYVVVDDTTPTLEQRKTALVHALTVDEIAATERAWPSRKRRIDGIRYSGAMAKIDADGADARDGEEKAFCAEYEGRLRKFAEIEKTSAQAQADIDDLTEETISAWSNPKFQ